MPTSFAECDEDVWDRAVALKLKSVYPVTHVAPTRGHRLEYRGGLVGRYRT